MDETVSMILGEKRQPIRRQGKICGVCEQNCVLPRQIQTEAVLHLIITVGKSYSRKEFRKDFVKHIIEGYRGYFGPYVNQLITLALLAACLLSSINAFVFLGFVGSTPLQVSAVVGWLENVRTETHIFNKFHGDLTLIVNRVKMVRVGLRPVLETSDSRIHDELDVIPAMKDVTHFFDNHIVLLGTQGRQLAIIDVPATFLEVHHLDSKSVRHHCAHAILIEFIILPVISVTTVLAALGLTIVLGLAGTWKILGEKASPYLREL